MAQDFNELLSSYKNLEYLFRFIWHWFSVKIFTCFEGFLRKVAKVLGKSYLLLKYGKKEFDKEKCLSKACELIINKDGSPISVQKVPVD